MPTRSPTGPASAIDTGISASDTKKSRLDTRPSRCAGTRRCSSVPQMTIAAASVMPTTRLATTITHSRVDRPKAASGRAPRPQHRSITVRYRRGRRTDATSSAPAALPTPYAASTSDRAAGPAPTRSRIAKGRSTSIGPITTSTYRLAKANVANSQPVRNR